MNTRAGNMSVFPDDPGHFLDWLRGRPETSALDAASFVTRRTYGDYLQSLLRDVACSERAAGRLYLVPDTPSRSGACGERFEITLGVGKDLIVDAAIVATGNPSPQPPGGRAYGVLRQPPLYRQPMESDGLRRVEPEDTVLMLGTGLTMVDVALLLRSRGHRGPLLALSRRGQVPRGHAAPGHAPDIVPPPLPMHLSQALRAIRAAVREAERRAGHGSR